MIGRRQLEARRQRKREARLLEDVRTLISDIKDVRKNLAILWHKTDAQLTDAYRARYPPLAANARRLLTHHHDSQRALLDIFETVEPDTRKFVDIGCGRSGGQCPILHQLFSWTGKFVDASERTVRDLQQAGLDAIRMTVTGKRQRARHGR